MQGLRRAAEVHAGQRAAEAMNALIVECECQHAQEDDNAEEHHHIGEWFRHWSRPDALQVPAADEQSEEDQPLRVMRVHKGKGRILLLRLLLCRKYGTSKLQHRTCAEKLIMSRAQSTRCRL